MRIALVGWGVETKSAFRYYGDEHDYFIVNEEPRDDFPVSERVSVKTNSLSRPIGQSGNSVDLTYLEGLEDNDLIIYTPTSRKNLEKVYGENHEIWEKSKSIMHDFFEKCPTKNIIGVTGTKGKGTTTTLIAKILEEAGNKVHVGGNIGIPVLDILPNISDDDWVVLELSSFQLYKFPYSPHIAVHLMMIPEHIAEWHKTMDDYVESKKHIFLNQSENDIAVYNPNNSYSSENVTFSPGKHIPYLIRPGASVENNSIVIDDVEICSVAEVALLGRHNLENICAAITAVWQVNQNTEAYRKVITTFSGLEHRLQLVREFDGVKYYDDSFGTTPDTAIVAMNSFTEDKIMIVGGHDKGNDFSEMIKRLNSDDIKKIICVGPTGRFIADELKKIGFDTEKIDKKDDVNNWTMQEIVDSAKKVANSGDIVLLSTGSASFGIFKDYKDRGEQFIESVNYL
jgi:UDP-N-acetylmuramoylalanine--D-glutamate ligase